MPAPRPQAAEAEALLAAAEQVGCRLSSVVRQATRLTASAAGLMLQQVAAVRIIGTMEEQLTEADRELTRLQQQVEGLMSAPFDAGSQLQAAVKAAAAAKLAADGARARRDETRLRLSQTAEVPCPPSCRQPKQEPRSAGSSAPLQQHLTKLLQAPPEFAELQERMSRLAKHPRFKSPQAKPEAAHQPGHAAGRDDEGLFEHFLAEVRAASPAPVLVALICDGHCVEGQHGGT
jgi:hypothetical protein